MKITRYAQSCILIETNNKRILIDPGCYQYDESLLEEWKNIDILLITHKHPDHLHLPAIRAIKPKKIYTSQEVANCCEEIKPTIVKEGDIIENIEVTKAIHGYVPFLKGKETQENFGFIINGEKKVYICGDTTYFKSDYKCDILIVPICGHEIVMNPKEAATFAKDTGAELIIPYHYESPNFPGDLEEVKREFKDLNYKILEYKETISV
jgi:L-ascorbate metabolism protein UlaG (beta-lactamase superfamily)